MRENDIIALLEQFQAGYAARDLRALDSFMDLFTQDVEVLGTNGSFPGSDEWFLDKDGARELVKGDWEDWGDVLLDIGKARISAQEDCGWISIPATVTKRIGEENYESYLAYAKDYIDKPGISARQKLHNILRGGTNTVFELNRGEKFVWPVRITAVVTRIHGAWKFAQMHFSFPTIYFPDVRLFDR